MRYICNEIDCVGCSACHDICPTKCISMIKNSEGFNYPTINNGECINCGLCGKVCPVKNNKTESSAAHKVFGANNNDIKQRISSSSGGIFMLLGNNVISRGGIVIAPVFDHSFKVVHSVASSFEELQSMTGSKYVQSELKDIFLLIKQKLVEGKEVLFSGTPCQVAGLKLFLGSKFDNLYTQDIICHGVPSPMIWQSYLSFLEKKYNSKLLSFNFRCKENGWDSYSIKATFENGETLIEHAKNNMYFLTYMMGMHFRKCCSNCKFKNCFLSDLTLGDFWGISKINPTYNDGKGVSLILAHTDKGQKMIDDIKDKIVLFPANYSEALKYNKSISESSKHSPIRNVFLKETIKFGFYRTFEKYCSKSLASKIRRKIVGIFQK